MRTSGPGSATMLEVPAGVAQLAEQPSCKRQVSGSNPLTGSLSQVQRGSVGDPVPVGPRLHLSVLRYSP